MSVSATDASNRFGALLDTVLTGKPATITRHGRAVARLARCSNLPIPAAAIGRVLDLAGPSEDAEIVLAWLTEESVPAGGGPA